jgi:urease subunit gamma
MLAPREIDKMMIWTAAQIAEGRKKRGVKLNYPETIAYVANFVVEGAREGKRVAELMKSAREILTRNDVMEGVPEMIHTVQVECNGTRSCSVNVGG